MLGYCYLILISKLTFIKRCVKVVEAVRILLEEILVTFSTFEYDYAGQSGMSSTVTLRQLRGLKARFKLLLELRGLGYKLKMGGPKRLLLDIGYSHTVAFDFFKDMLATGVGLKSRVLQILDMD